MFNLYDNQRYKKIRKKERKNADAMFMSYEAPCNIDLAKKTHQTMLMRNVFGGRGSELAL